MKRIFAACICLILLLSACYSNTVVLQAENSPVKSAAVISAETTAKASLTPDVSLLPSASSSAESTVSVKADVIASPEPTVTIPDEVNVLVAGDIMCLYAQICGARKGGKYDFDYCFSKINEKVAAADLAVGNLETLVASGYPYTQHNQEGNPKVNAPESFLSAVTECGFDVLTNANNHIFDRRTSGINKTVAKLNKYGVKHTGAYASGETRTQLIVNVKGVNIAVLAYTDIINNAAKSSKVDRYSKSKLKADIAAVKAAGADYIIVLMHWGKERTHKVNRTQKDQAKYIAKAGANIIIGSHPHCVQGSDLIKTDHGNVPVFYSLGNYISSMGATMCRDSMMVNIKLIKDPITGETTLSKLTYTATFCTSSGGKGYVVFPADLASIKGSSKAGLLKSSRARTIRIVGKKAATPE